MQGLWAVAMGRGGRQVWVGRVGRDCGAVTAGGVACHRQMSHTPHRAGPGAAAGAGATCSTRRRGHVTADRQTVNSDSTAVCEI